MTVFAETSLCVSHVSRRKLTHATYAHACNANSKHVRSRARFRRIWAGGLETNFNLVVHREIISSRFCDGAQQGMNDVRVQKSMSV